MKCVSDTVIEGVTDYPSILAVNNSENEKMNKATVAFLLPIVDKMSPLGVGLIIWGVVYSHGSTPLLKISDAWVQVLLAGGLIYTISCIILAGSASYFKEMESPEHPGFVICSMMVFFKLLFLVLLTCRILLGFERSSIWVIWPVGVLLQLSVVLVWVSFQRQPMIVGLKWAENALAWMKAKISEWRLRDESLPQMQA